MSTNIVIQGDGVAAYCTARLLRRAGHRVSLARTERSRVPAIMLSDASLALIRDVFGRPELLRGAHRIETRVVAWGKRDAPCALKHSAVVVSEESLLEALGEGLALVDDPADSDASWRILASRPLPEGAVQHRFGSRHASAVKVETKDGFDFGSCWIESLENGWLFLIPDSPESAWLLSVGEPAEWLVDSSRAIAKEIKGLLGSGKTFPSAPSIMEPLAGEGVLGAGWLACGTAAMGFDPICGDGTAHAIREAILAAAVVQAALRAEKISDLLAHYSARLTGGFRRHLGLCGNLYSSGFGGSWWDAELDWINRGIAWCSRQISPATEFHYQLRGFELEARA